MHHSLLSSHFTTYISPSSFLTRVYFTPLNPFFSLSLLLTSPNLLFTHFVLHPSLLCLSFSLFSSSSRSLFSPRPNETLLIFSPLVLFSIHPEYDSCDSSFPPSIMSPLSLFILISSLPYPRFNFQFLFSSLHLHLSVASLISSSFHLSSHFSFVFLVSFFLFSHFVSSSLQVSINLCSRFYPLIFSSSFHFSSFTCTFAPILLSFIFSFSFFSSSKDTCNHVFSSSSSLHHPFLIHLFLLLSSPCLLLLLLFFPLLSHLFFSPSLFFIISSFHKNIFAAFLFTFLLILSSSFLPAFYSALLLSHSSSRSLLVFFLSFSPLLLPPILSSPLLSPLPPLPLLSQQDTGILSSHGYSSSNLFLLSSSFCPLSPVDSLHPPFQLLSLFVFPSLLHSAPLSLLIYCPTLHLFLSSTSPPVSALHPQFSEQ